MTIRHVKTACPLDCWDCCSMIAHVEEGRVIKVEGDPDHPITQGVLCGKGKKLVDRMYHPERVLAPKKKVDGVWTDISWEQAFSEIADAMRVAKAEFGPTSVMLAFDSGSGGLLKALEGRFFNLFGGYTDAQGSLCWGAGLEAMRFDTGTARTSDPMDLENSASVVLWGRNVSVTNMHMVPFLKAAKKKGARWVVINPLPTDLDGSADWVVRPRPGTDGALALAVAKIVWEQGAYDSRFVQELAVGFDTFTEYLRAFSIEDAEELTGIKRKEMERLASLYVEGPTSTLLGLGMQRYQNGGQTIRSIHALAAMTGNIGVAGGGVQYANQIWQRWFDWDALTLPEKRQEYRAFSRVRQAEEILSAAPPIRVLFSARANPVAQTPNAARTRLAYETIDCVVVMDQFFNDTAEFADYFLPTTSVFEEEDILFTSMWHPNLTYVNKCVEPLGETKSDWQIFAGLADQLGFGEEYGRPLQEWMQAVLQPLEEVGVTVERLQQEGTIAAPSPAIAWAGGRFETPSEKFEFYSEIALQVGLPPIPSYQPNLDDNYPYHLLSVHPRRSLNTQHYHLGKPGAVQIELSPELAQREGLLEGDRVEIFNDRGALAGIIHVVPGIHPETIKVEQGRWRAMTDGVAINDLTPNHHSDMGLSSALYDCTCAIRKQV